MKHIDKFREREKESNLSRIKEFSKLKELSEKREKTLKGMRKQIKEHFLTLNTDKLIFFNKSDIDSRSMPECFYEREELNKLDPVRCKLSNGDYKKVMGIVKGKFGGVYLDIWGLGRPIGFEEINDLESLFKIWSYIINITPDMVERQAINSESDKFGL